MRFLHRCLIGLGEWLSSGLAEPEALFFRTLHGCITQ